MSIPVLYDACVLYGNEVRDLLIRIAISGMVRAHWTDEILDETFGNLVANRSSGSSNMVAVFGLPVDHCGVIEIGPGRRRSGSVRGG